MNISGNKIIKSGQDWEFCVELSSAFDGIGFLFISLQISFGFVRFPVERFLAKSSVVPVSPWLSPNPL